MANRSYTIRALTDDHGNPLAEVWVRAFNASTGALIETQYTDATGVCTFTTLPDDVNVNVCAVWGKEVKWVYNIFSATQDLLYLSVTEAIIANLAVTNAKIANATILDAKISTCSIDKLTVGSLTVALTISTGGTISALTGGAGVKISPSGINIFGLANALTTRATEAGTIQCYIGTDGKLYAGAGNIILGESGLDVKYGANFRMFYGAVQIGSLAIASTSIALNSDENLNLSSGGITKKITLFPTGGNGVVVYHNLFYPDGTDRNVDVGSATYRFKRVYGNPVIPAYGVAAAEEGSFCYSWSGTILTLFVYASGSWRMHPTP